jgi:hypothetical protein
MKTALLAAAALLYASAAHAVVEPLGLMLCRNLAQDDAARLKCYDAIADALLSKDAERPAPETAWKIEESLSPIDDSPQVEALLPAVGGDGRLMLRCKERRIEAAASFGLLSILGVGSDIDVTYRINRAPARTAKWIPSTRGNAAFARNAWQFMAALPDDAALFIRAVGFGGRSHDATFQLGDVSSVRDKIAGACLKAMKQKR